MEGTIECESEVGKGTKFTVTIDLPIDKKPVEEMVLPPIKVLIVDDVYTSGSTINAMIKLVKKAHPKSIKILILSKQLHNQEDRIKYKRN